MRSQITSVAAAVLLLTHPEVADARKQLVDANETRLATYQSPLVSTETCEDYCIFGKNDGETKVFWCFAFTEPLVTVGWEYNQDANTSTESTPLKHLRFDLLFYLTTQFQITSTMDIFRLYYNQSMAELEQVDTKLDLGMIMNERWQYCPHLSWTRGAITFNSTYRQEFMNCSKVLVKNFWDTEGVWKGKYAKYFEECARSQAGSTTSDDPQVTATLWNKDWKDAISERVILGSVDPESGDHCGSLPGVPTYTQDLETGDLIQTSNESALVVSIYQMIFNFMHTFQNYGKNFKGNYQVI